MNLSANDSKVPGTSSTQPTPISVAPVGATAVPRSRLTPTLAAWGSLLRVAASPSWIVDRHCAVLVDGTRPGPGGVGRGCPGASSPMRVDGGVLTCRDDLDNARFAVMVRRLAAPFSPVHIDGSTRDTLAIDDGAGRPVPVVLSRIESGGLGGDAADDGPACVLVQALTRAHERAIDEGVLRKVFGLTVAEARVAAHIVQGLPPKSIAARLGIAVHTVRSQLKAVFAKTGTSRQAELVLVLAELSRAV